MRARSRAVRQTRCNALDRAYTYDPIGNRTESVEGTAAVEYGANSLSQNQAPDADAGCPTPSETFSYDDDGNLTESNATGTIAPGTGGGGGPRQQDYVWDAENLLAAVLPAGTPASGDQKVEFTYDFRGRRVEKRVCREGRGNPTFLLVELTYFTTVLQAQELTTHLTPPDLM